MKPSKLLVPTILALAACPSKPTPVATVPTPILEAPPPVLADQGELVLRSSGIDIGHEKFEIHRAGDNLDIALTATTTYPAPLSIALTMRVEAASWRVDSFDLTIDRGAEDCIAHLRDRGDAMELEIEYPDGERVRTDREGREHAEYYVSIRPTISQAAFCAVADDQPRALESFPPWYIARTAPREASELPTADGARRLDRVKVDELIDVYCDGETLAIVHYPAHAFIAARKEYDDVARGLTASDPSDAPWAGELACPPRLGGLQ